MRDPGNSRYSNPTPPVWKRSFTIDGGEAGRWWSADPRRGTDHRSAGRWWPRSELRQSAVAARQDAPHHDDNPFLHNSTAVIGSRLPSRRFQPHGEVSPPPIGLRRPHRQGFRRGPISLFLNGDVRQTFLLTVASFFGGLLFLARLRWRYGRRPGYINTRYREIHGWILAPGCCNAHGEVVAFAMILAWLLLIKFGWWLFYSNSARGGRVVHVSAISIPWSRMWLFRGLVLATETCMLMS